MSGKIDAMRIARQLQIVPLSEREWRIADRYEEECSAAKVIGVIQENADGFEATSIGARTFSATFESFESALAFFAET